MNELFFSNKSQNFGFVSQIFSGIVDFSIIWVRLIELLRFGAKALNISATEFIDFSFFSSWFINLPKISINSKHLDKPIDSAHANNSSKNGTLFLFYIHFQNN